MTTEQQIASLQASVDRLTNAVTSLCQHHGARLSKQQLADRLKVHRNTLSNMLDRDRRMPRPGSDGKFLLAEVIAWEAHGKLQ